jgi:hypothetical protein
MDVIKKRKKTDEQHSSHGRHQFAKPGEKSNT